MDDGGGAIGEERIAGTIAPTPAEATLAAHLHQRGHVPQHQRVVHRQLGIKAEDAVFPRCQRNVVQRADLLHLAPGGPGGGEGQFVAGGLEAGDGGAHLGPGRGGLVGVQPGAAEGVLVVEHDRGRGIERHRHHPAVAQAVIALDGRQVVVEIDAHAGLGQQFMQRLHRAAGGHHGAGADFEHLHDVRRARCAEAGDGGHHRLRIGAAEAGDDLETRLAGVEGGDIGLQQAAERLRQAMPEGNLDRATLRQGRGGDGQGEAGGGQAEGAALHAVFSHMGFVGWRQVDFQYCSSMANL